MRPLRLGEMMAYRKNTSDAEQQAFQRDLLRSVKQMKTGKVASNTKVKVPPVVTKSNSQILTGYIGIHAGIVDLLESARRASARAVNALLTATYWEIGRRIVLAEQGGKRRADYGERLIERLAADLTKRFGRGFGRRNLFQVRAFYLAYPDVVQTASARFRSERGTKLQTPSAEWADLTFIAPRFPLPWSHYVCLLSVEKPEARKFYEEEKGQCTRRNRP